MRLTLRTLLAYLDDTLAAGEIKAIGEKVAESDAAQELIGRIKQVTRRRRLTAPPATGPGAFDPNDVAEYLDNSLDSDKLADVEKQCLESDVHLAEIAACHQILTLVLGEPALVPPKAKERMYGLVKTRESIPYRKAAPTRKPSESGREEDQLPGLSDAWLKFVLPAAAVLLLAALGTAVWMLSGDGRRTPTVANNGDRKVGDDKGKDGDAAKDKQKDQDKPADKDKAKDADKDKNTLPPPDKDTKDKDGAGKDKEKDAKKDKGKPDDDDPPKAALDRRPPPSKERAVVATFRGGYDDRTPGVLLTRKAADTGSESWFKAFSTKGENQISSTDTLLTLPGFANVIESRSGVRVLMRGSLPEYAISPDQLGLLESAVVLHASKEVDLDLTLLRGRIYLSNAKESGPAKVRLRFGENQVWDVTLADPKDEVAADLQRTYNVLTLNPEQEEPFALMRLVLLRGEATVNVNAFDEYTERVSAPKAVLFPWDSDKFHGVVRLDKLPPTWDKQPPSGEVLRKGQAEVIKSMNVALKNLEARLKVKGKDDTAAKAIKEARDKDDAPSRLLGVYCMGAIDDVFGVLDALGDNNEAHALDRNKAGFVLRQWVARGQGNTKLLFDEKNGTGMLMDKFKKAVEAKTLYELLFVLPRDKWDEKETYEGLAATLQSKNVAIAELGYEALLGVSRGMVRFSPFNAAMSLEDRKKAADEVFEMIEKKLLPPRLPVKDKDKDKK